MDSSPLKQQLSFHVDVSSSSEASRSTTVNLDPSQSQLDPLESSAQGLFSVIKNLKLY
jgi:hypothetical protein